MDYFPRYSQPFTLAEATNLDVSIITDEIARLQNSLKHLRETQDLLKSALGESGEPDEELQKALEENETVIGSQEERISILKLALSQKGVSTSDSHYDSQPSPPVNPRFTAVVNAPTPQLSERGDNDEGVYL
ncbi:unnamed protein product [Cyclocybe aegerita]|uniref:Uncharacterized protein n=1 Tax=Cyclocybe aegerita TaxID=1973307 RepID=A0A8S0W779_CYCAE|nr:unnamed protein product [Cyclocybe aegerita]